MRIDLIKYQALGNDYLVLDLPMPLDDVLPLVPRLCDRNFGLGSDGLLLFDPSAMTLRVINPDGSEAEKSGNGLRIAAAHAVLEHSAGDSFSLSTVGGPNPVRVLARSGGGVVSQLDIGAPSVGEGRVVIETPAGAASAVLVSVGNPHAVLLDQPVTPERAREIGPHVEHHPMFPDRTNVSWRRLSIARTRGSRSGSGAPATPLPRGPAPRRWRRLSCVKGWWMRW